MSAPLASLPVLSQCPQRGTGTPASCPLPARSRLACLSCWRKAWRSGERAWPDGRQILPTGFFSSCSESDSLPPYGGLRVTKQDRLKTIDSHVDNRRDGQYSISRKFRGEIKTKGYVNAFHTVLYLAGIAASPGMCGPAAHGRK